MKPNILLFENETLLLEMQPKHSLVNYLLIKKGFNSLLLVPPLFFVFFLSLAKPTAVELGLYTFLVIIVTFLVFYVWAKFAVSKYWYIFTDQRCIFYSGFFNIRKRLVPYQRIVDVEMSQGPLEKLFNIASVKITEQGTSTRTNNSRGLLFILLSSDPSAILGLSYSDAEKLANLIGQHIVKNNRSL